MKTTAFELNGQVFHLCLNGAALFDLYDKFGKEAGLMEPIAGNDREGYNATCFYLATLANQGEIVRRYQGYDAGKFTTENFFRANLAVWDVARAKEAVKAALFQGFYREEKDPEERIDLGLLELEKKTGPG